MKEILEKIKNKVLTTNKTPPPMVYLFARNNEHLLIPLNYNKDEDKENSHLMIGKILRTGQFEGFCHVADSFMVEKKKGDDISVQPRDDPKRIDVIVITYKNDKGEGEITIVPYDKKDDNIIIREKEIKTQKLNNKNMVGKIWDMWK